MEGKGTDPGLGSDASEVETACKGQSRSAQQQEPEKASSETSDTAHEGENKTGPGPQDQEKTTGSDTDFEPIRGQRRLSADTIRTLRRERSNNGWGVDDIEAGDAGESTSPDNREVPDPFEVGWDGGDSDPLCPRSMPTWRKWLIIGITSIGSFCV